MLIIFSSSNTDSDST